MSNCNQKKATPTPAGTPVTGAGGKRGAAAAEQLSSSPGGDEDLLDLACGETIPGSPVHPSSDPTRHDLQAGSATAALPTSKSKSSSSSVSYQSSNIATCIL